MCFLDHSFLYQARKSQILNVAGAINVSIGRFLRYSKGNLMAINNMSIRIKVCGSLHRNSMLVTHDNSDNVLTVNAS